MTIRKDLSIIHNKWNNAQRVDLTDLEVEQNRDIQTDAAIIQNHFGSGVLLDFPESRVLFDSNNLNSGQAEILAAGNFDGQGMAAHLQPSDSTLGNQLEVELTGSDVFGRFSVKVAVIGLDFNGDIQADRFYFRRNEKQVTSKHYTRILAIFFNDFKGNNNCSRNLGGRITVKEAASFQLSRDALMVSQDLEPDIFWRDFKVADSTLNLSQTLQAGIGSEHNIDGLNINVTGTTSRSLIAGDVTTRIGQKFKATTNNIQKVTLLLAVSSDGYEADADTFDWTGDLVVSVYPLQTSVVSPSDIVPDLAIEFDPTSTPLAQLSVNQSTLEDYGYVLNDVPQPVDFVFNATKIGSGSTSKITAGKYYAVVVGRSGAANTGTVYLATATDRLSDSRLTIFSNVWVDVPEEDLWFQVWTDAGKIASGRGYDGGNGMQYDKTTIDSTTGGTIDYSVEHKHFTNTGENILNIGILEATEESSVKVQDERSGSNIFSRQKFVPTFSFITESELTELQETSEPLIIGCAEDVNAKQNPDLTKTQTYVGLAKGDEYTIINPDADLLSLNLVGSKLVPNSSCANKEYKIFKVQLCTDGYGDVNGDGYIDSDDISAASDLIGESLLLESTQQKIIDGYFSTLELLRADVDGDGYVTSTDVDLITQYVNKTLTSFPAGATFTHLVLKVQQATGRFDGYYDCDGYVRLDGYTGLNIVSPDSLSSYELLYDGYLSDPILESDSAYTTVPFSDIEYQILFKPYWQPEMVLFGSDARIVPCSFSYNQSLTANSCADPLLFECEDRPGTIPNCDPGRNDLYIPGNLIIKEPGQIVRPDGSAYDIDLEIGTIILQLPATPLENVNLNIFDKFVADRSDGFTRAGFPAMRYSDCTTVQDEDLALNRVRFGVSIQSYYPSLDGYTTEDGYGIVVDNIIGVHMSQSTGILSLSLQDLDVDEVYKTLVTKIQILVYLKKAGWKNNVITVEPEQVAGLLA